MTPSRPTSGEAALRTAARKLLDLWGLEGMSAAADTLEDVLAATPTPTPGLDVERLARAMNTDGGDPPLWDILGERTREQYRAKARVIAAEYDRLSR